MAGLMCANARCTGSGQSAPGVTEQHEVAPVQPERLADLLHLVDEPAQVPQRRLVRLIAEPGAELVVPAVARIVTASTIPRTAVAVSGIA
jgi:hypothetical protein